MPDGKITFSTALDNKEMEKELKGVGKEIEKATAEKGKATAAKLPLEKQLESLNEQLEVAKNNLEEYRQRVSDAEKTIHSETATPEDIAAAQKALPEDQGYLKNQEAQVEKLKEKWEAVNEKIREYDAVIENADARIEEGTEKAGEMRAELSGAGAKLRDTMEEAGVSIDKIKKRIAGLASRVFIFTMITKALRVARDYFGKLLEKNQEFQAQLAKLRGALATAFQPLYEAAVPVLIKILEILTKITMVAAHVISILFGKTASQSAKNAEALNSEAEAIKGVGTEAKEASKQLAGFDEINKLDAQDTGAGGTGGISGMEEPSKFDFSEFDTEEYKNKIDELTVYLSGALLALGAILAFSGANIPLGLALMAAGALGLAAVVKENWGAMDDSLKQAIALVALGLGAELLVIGAVLAFSGANIPLGIGLMIAGAASMGAAVALNWNGIASAMQGPLGKIVAIVSGALLALGAILVFSGANIPLGIALIAAGAAGMVTVGALNWNAVQEKLREAWDGIKQWWGTNVSPKLTLQYWKEKFAGIAEGLKTKIKDGINAAISLINRFIQWLNSRLNFSWDGLTINGKSIFPAGSIRLVNIPTIPMLAQGAVIPPNAPFMAMLGDQKYGNNIEAPEDLIRKIVREEAGKIALNQEFAFSVDLDGVTVARKLWKYTKQVNAEHGESLVTGAGGL